MLTKHIELTWRTLQFVLPLLLLAGAVLCIFPPHLFLLKWGATYATQIMFGYLALGILFFLLGQDRLMFTSFICCFALCVFLKESFSPILKNPEQTDEPKVKISHFNLANADENLDTTIAAMLRSDADLLSIQEVQYMQDSFLLQSLRETYPHSIVIPSLGLYGIAIFSKTPINHKDTIWYDNAPMLSGSIPIGERGEVHFISAYMAPPLSLTYYEKMQEQLDIIQQKCLQIDKPLLIFGDYNVVSWSDELKNFRAEAHLHDSRRGVMPTSPHGMLNFFEVPFDHIFYSGHFACLAFETLSSETSRHLGIQGVYQFELPTELEL